MCNFDVNLIIELHSIYTYLYQLMNPQQKITLILDIIKNYNNLHL